MVQWKLIFYAVSAASLATNVMILVGGSMEATAMLLRPFLPLLYAFLCIILVAISSMVVAKVILVRRRTRIRRRRRRRTSAPRNPLPTNLAIPARHRPQSRRSTLFTIEPFQDPDTRIIAGNSDLRVNPDIIQPRVNADIAQWRITPDMNNIVQPDVHERDGQTQNINDMVYTQELGVTHNINDMVQPAYIQELGEAQNINDMVQPAHTQELGVTQNINDMVQPADIQKLGVTRNINDMVQPTDIQELGVTPDILQLDIAPDIDHQCIHHNNDDNNSDNKSHNVLDPHPKSHNVHGPLLKSHNLLGPHLTLHRPRRDDQLDRDELHQRAENFIIKFKRSLTMQREASYNRLLALLHSKSIR